MYLSGLELFGFKSFPDRTKLQFDQGVIAIVGPNGCGKSNLVDAVRWVLGEQRSAALRSGKMENIIFAGANGRKPLHAAEVTLTVENNRGVLPRDYQEVAITRRLTRNGDSSYFINKRPCRLKDIRNLFADTGLGPDSYAIIELAMVESILSGKTEERRRLFEEAAGVTLYKVRLKASWNKLQLTEADLVRLEDVFHEVESRRNSLRRQVAKARRFRNLREALRIKELKGAWYELSDLQTRISPLEQQAQEDKLSLEALNKKLERCETDRGRLRGKLSANEEKLSENRKKRSLLESRIQGIQHEIVRLEERLRSGTMQNEQQKFEEDELLEREQEIASRITSLHELREEKKEVYETILGKYELIDQKWKELEIRKTTKLQEENRLQQSVFHANNALERTRERLQQFENQLTSTREKVKNLENESSAVIDSREVEEANEQVLKAQELLVQITSEQESMYKEYSDLREERSRLQANLKALQHDKEAAKQRVHLLEGIVQRGEGRTGAEKAILSAGLKDVLGRIGDALSVPDALQVPVASVLQGVLSAIAVRDQHAMRDIVLFLESHPRGRGMLVPLEMNPGDATKTPPFNQDKRCLGRLSDMVRYTSEAGNTARRFMEDCWVVEDLDALFEFATAAASAGITLVTREGTLLRPDGVFFAGQPGKGDFGAVEMLKEAENRLKKTETNLKQTESILGETLEKEKTLEIQIASLRVKEKKQRVLVEEKQNRWNKLRSQRQSQITLLNRRKEEIDVLNREIQAINDHIKEEKSALEQADEQLVQAETALQTFHEKHISFDEEVHEIHEEREHLLQKKIGAGNDVKRLETDIRHLGENLNEIKARVATLRKSQENNVSAQDDANQRLQALRAEEEHLDSEIREAKHIGMAARKQYDSAVSKLAEVDGLLTEYRTEQTQLSDKIHRSELTLSDYNHRMISVTERIKENYNIDIIAVRLEDLPLTPSENNPYLENPLSELRESLRTIGLVNEMALEEFEEVDERYHLLSEQMEDLKKAKQTLEETISEINRIARDRFLRTFERVKVNFGDLFSRLFEGGEATLELLDGDPLESGIRIFARPRGKSLASIEMMSGGEKTLTAISLLFALYMEKPAPFCFLDEVDAPLDDVNIIRFNNLLREFTDKTQFLVVTHNKLTMEKADRLYGVTMENAGISQLVTVQIERDQATIQQSVQDE